MGLGVGRWMLNAAGLGITFDLCGTTRPVGLRFVITGVAHEWCAHVPMTCR